MRAVLLVLVASTLAGCGLSDPYASRSTTTSDQRTAPTSELEPSRDRAATTPVEALERFASIYVNWTAATLEGRQRQLASISVGRARAGALRAADAAAVDKTRLRARVRNRGSVVSISPGTGSAHGRWVVVTVETTSGRGPYAGLPPNSLHVTYATVARAGRGYTVSSWSPRS